MNAKSGRVKTLFAKAVASFVVTGLCVVFSAQAQPESDVRCEPQADGSIVVDAPELCEEPARLSASRAAFLIDVGQMRKNGEGLAYLKCPLKDGGEEGFDPVFKVTLARDAQGATVCAAEHFQPRCAFTHDEEGRIKRAALYDGDRLVIEIPVDQDHICRYRVLTGNPKEGGFELTGDGYRVFLGPKVSGKAQQCGITDIQPIQIEAQDEFKNPKKIPVHAIERPGPSF